MVAEDMQSLRRAMLALLCAALVAAVGVSTATGGTAPKRTDKNLGWVLSKPQIHNLLWDDNWTGHNSITKGQIHTFSKRLAAGSWAGPASQYGVKSLTLVETKESGGLCDKRPSSTVSTAKVLLWVACMILPGTGVQIPTPRLPISNDLYVVYLPESTTISDNLSIDSFTVLGKTFGPFTFVKSTSCDDYGAYHALSLYLGGLYPIAIIPAKCAGGSIDKLTAAASHEIIEAATDPIPGAGWIDTSIPNSSPSFRRLKEGEVGDICSSAGAVPTATLTRGGFAVVPYWSNSAGACVG